MEKDIWLRQENKELRCPHCGSGGLKVSCVYIHDPIDRMVVAFDTDQSLSLREIDGGRADEPGSVSLSIDCPSCTAARGDAFYLLLEHGKTRVRDRVAKAHWSTDRGDDPNSMTKQLLKAFVEAGEGGLSTSEAADIVNKK